VPLAVIPWFQLPAPSLGPVTIQTFGVLSALGILLATLLTSRAARELGLDPADEALVLGANAVRLLRIDR